jgi:hypothetical protein
VGRKRENGVELPPGVHAVKSRRAVYYHWQPGRGAVRVGERVSLGKDPGSPEFWAKLNALKALPAPMIRRQDVVEERIAAKSIEFVENGLEPVCCLYRHYDPHGDLVYVGVSLSPLRRNEKHAASSNWRHMILRILIEPFASRQEALSAETRAIREEFPRFNKVHNRRRHAMEELRRIAEENAKRSS